MDQGFINESKDVLAYIEAFHLKAVMRYSIAGDFFCGSFASFVQWLQTLFRQKVAEVSTSVDDSGHKGLIARYESI